MAPRKIVVTAGLVTFTLSSVPYFLLWVSPASPARAGGAISDHSAP